MKTSTILRNAAKRLAEDYEADIKGGSRGCCYAILIVAKFQERFNKAHTFMRNLYREDSVETGMWEAGYWFGTEFNAEQTCHRINALLFAAEMAESEGD